MKPLVIANWKMQLGEHESVRLAQAMCEELKGIKNIEIVVAPSFPALSEVGKIIKKSSITLGAQDVSLETNGASTGDVSIGILKELGVQYVIVGHSERRKLHGETDEMVHEKCGVVLAHSMIPVVCVGEMLEDYEHGDGDSVVQGQIKKIIGKHMSEDIVIAYEPLWAIGTGISAKPEYAAKMHAVIRTMVGKQSRIIYGGSIDSNNVAGFCEFPEVQGFLVGGSSLRAQSFGAIVKIVNTKII